MGSQAIRDDQHIVETYYPDTTERAQAKVVEVAESSEATNIDITIVRLAAGVSVSGRVVDGKSGETCWRCTDLFHKDNCRWKFTSPQWWSDTEDKLQR